MPAELTYEPHVVPPRAGPRTLSPLQEEVLALKREKNAVILAHNYQVEAIQEVADFVGDSLGLSYQAQAAQADVILFCGVHFMAETAKIVNPGRTVLLPDLHAGCSSPTPARLRGSLPTRRPIRGFTSWPTSIAPPKSKRWRNVICTSGNAVQIVNRVPADREILFVPDQNLGQWVSQRTGRPMQLWPGSCYAHVQFTVQALEKVRLRFPEAPVVAHPECVQTVRDLADEVCSTELMVKFARTHPAREIIVATESGMLHRLRREVPDKTFIAAPTDSCACNDCRFMKMNTIEKVRDALRSGAPQIDVPESTRHAALVPIQRMLDWSRR